MTAEREVAVIGGGMAGLAAGALLAQRGRRVVVLEAAASVGGRAMHAIDGATTRQAHVVFDAGKSPLAAILQELGLNLPFATAPPGSFHFEHGGRLAAAPMSPWAFIRSPFLSGRGKRHAAALVLSALRETPEAVYGERLDQWMERVEFDEEARGFFRDAAPSLTWCADTDDLDTGAFLHQFQAALAARNRWWYLPGGTARLAQAFQEVIEANGGMVLPDMRVTGLEVDNGAVTRIRLQDETERRVKGVVIAAPAWDLPELVAGTPLADEVRPFAEPESAGGLVVSVTLSKRVFPMRCLYDTSRRFLIHDPSLVDASVAPPGGQFLQCLAFIRKRNLHSAAHAAHAREGIAAMLDAHAPEWRDHLVSEVDNLHLRLVGVRHRVGQAPPNLLQVRSGVVENVAYAGDTVGVPGRLSNVAFRSARLAADALSPASRITEPA